MPNSQCSNNKRTTKGAEHISIKNDAIRLQGLLARLEPHMHRHYKFTLGRVLLDWSTMLMFRIDRMLMQPDKGAALEEVAATVRTIEATLLNLVALRGLPEVSPVTEADVARICVSIEEQARSMWRANRDRQKRQQTSHDNSGQGATPTAGGAPAR